MGQILDLTCKWYNIAFVFLFLTSLSMIISKLIYVATNYIASFIFMAEYYFVVYTYNIFIIYLLMNIKDNLLSGRKELQRNEQTTNYSEIPSHAGNSIFSLLRKFPTVFTVAAPIYISTNSVGGFPFLHVLYIIY